MALPDYPGLKRDISARLLLIMRAGHDQEMGPFAESPHITYHEGDTSEFSTVDGETREVEFATIEMESPVTLSELPAMTDDQIETLMYQFGVDMGKKTVQSFFNSLDQTLTAAGQTMDAGGRPIDAELLLTTFEMIEFSFDDNGQLIMPSFVGGSAEQRSAVQRLMTEDAQFRSDFAALAQRKKEEWLARESHRKLVD